MKPGLIYMDNCITSKPAPEVLEAMQAWLTEKFWYPGSFVSTGEIINEDITNFKATIASTLGAAPEEIHFTSGGTLANNMAIKGLAAAYAKQGKHVICSVVDYPDLLTNAAYLENLGFEVSYLSADSEGFIDLDELKSEIRPDTILFMTTIVNHVVGTIQPIGKIRSILESADHKIYFHADAGQAYGKMLLDVNELGVDTLSVSAHKIHGPQGIGALYQRKGVKLGQIIHGVRRIDNLQTGGMNVALIAGFAKAAELSFADIKATESTLRELSNYLLERIEATIPEVELNGPRGAGRAPHNINVSIDYIEGEAITMMLDMHGITVATGSACASQGLQANYVLMAIGKNHVQSHGSMKFTLSRYNTKAEIDTVVEHLAEISKELRSRSPLYNAKKNQEK
ncbi:MAG TPA: cysteine desulfurase family protein [Candidatus Cloacimonadota bacterium]|nr:cysteine desulfurase family protein [Candidatus Cloacimonadota bacterium]HPS38107.1 cysteine desulfurase family protein [Candidatus Cloacimonadota bacterium]